MKKKSNHPKLPLPPNKETVTIHYHSPPNREGQRGFIMQWWDAGFHLGPQWRGQAFRAEPSTYIEKAKAQGFKVLEFES